MSVLANESVDERRFAGVGTAHDGELGYVVELLGFVVGLLRQFLYHFVQQVAGAVAVDCRYRVWVAQAQSIELGHVVDPFVGVYLVGYQNNRFARFAQNFGHMVVEVGGAVHRVDHEQYFVSLFYGQLNLFVDFRFENVIGVYYPTAGVDY